MAYSFTERKRIRKDFGHLPEPMDYLTCCPFRRIPTPDFYNKG